MKTQDVEAQALQLYEQLGARAIATAAHRAMEQEHAGNEDGATTWRRIERRLKERRGPRQS